MSGIQELKDKLSSSILKRYGIGSGSEKYDLGFQVFLNTENINLGDNLYIYNTEVDQYWYLKQLVYNTLMSVDPELQSIPIEIKISIDENYGPYDDQDSLHVVIPKKKEILKNLNPEWLYNNYDLVHKFMSPSYKPYEDLCKITEKINNKFLRL